MSVYFGPFQLGAGEIVVIDPVMDTGGGGGASCSMTYVDGYVKDARDLFVLEHAKVVLTLQGTSTAYGTSTSSSGYYKIYVDSGTYEVRAGHTAYKQSSPVTVTVSVNSDGTCTTARVNHFLDLKPFGAVSMHDCDAAAANGACDSTNNRLDEAFGYIRELNAWHVRTDFWWMHLEEANCSPEPWCWDAAKVDFYQTYLTEAYDKGLDVVVILTGFPSWALYAYEQNDKDTFFYNWRKYCYGVARMFGDRVYYYQMSNEENHGITSPIAQEDEPRLFAECFQGLLDGEAVSQGAHKEQFKSAVNVFANWQDWDPILRGWLADPLSADAIDIIGIDHYPSTHSFDGCDYWAPLDSLSQIMLDFSPREGAVWETGYSTYDTFHNEFAQATYINCALPVIKQKVDDWNALHPDLRFLIINWYELLDADTWWPGCAIDPTTLLCKEKHFGVMRSDWTKKPGFNSLATRISEFGGP